jgi:hypothetical protein
MTAHGVNIYNVCQNDSHIKNKNMNYIDAVIMYNNFDVVKYLIDNGVRPTNNIILIYSACWECINGESYSCNFRNVTTNYVCTFRFGLTISELISGLNKIFDNDFRFCYTYFCGPANSDQVFNVAGKNVIEPADNDDDNNDDHVWSYKVYETAPKILSYKKINDDMTILY